MGYRMSDNAPRSAFAILAAGLGMTLGSALWLWYVANQAWFN